MSHPNVKLNIALKLVIFSIYNSTGNETKEDDFFIFLFNRTLDNDYVGKV